MYTNSTAFGSEGFDLSSEITWSKLYPALRSLARYLVYSFHVPSWRGQEGDIVEDIVQETARRLIERFRKAERGEASPIHSLEHMMVVIAQNYCKDLRRHDRRLSHTLLRDYSADVHSDTGEQAHLLESVTEDVYQELLFMLVAYEIASFPDKQRIALLIDLANRMCFDTQPTALQKAFLQVGIQLQQYRQPLPADPKERSRQVACLSYAYQRVGRLPCVQEYMLDT